MWGLIFGLLIAIVIAGFASLNSAPVSVNFLFAKAPSVPLALLVLLSVLLGVVIAALFGTPQYIKTRKKIKELENKIKYSESGETKDEETEKKIETPPEN
jgi:lipopolysaccharide assembly protein A